MAEISLINIGGTNYGVKDKVAREQSSMYGKNIGYDEPGTTASQPYPKVGTIIFWHSAVVPIWVYTKTAIAKGERFQLGVNVEQKPTLGTMISDIKTYVDGDGKLHFVDSRGADTELNFSSDPFPYSYWLTTYPNTRAVITRNNGNKPPTIVGIGFGTTTVSADGVTISWPTDNGGKLRVTGKHITGYTLQNVPHNDNRDVHFRTFNHFIGESTNYYDNGDRFSQINFRIDD